MILHKSEYFRRFFSKANLFIIITTTASTPTPTRFHTPISNTTPTKLKDYRVGNTISKGSYGCVKKAVHLPTGCSVALKIIQVVTFRKMKFKHPVKEALREGKILSSIRHPNIVRVYEYWYEKLHDSVYISMELAHCSLSDLIENRVTSSVFCKRKIMHDVLRGLHHIHHVHSIAHCDVKDKNILYFPSPSNGSNSGGTFKLCDFGLYCDLPITSGHAISDYQPCTVTYRPPENMRPEKHRKHRVCRETDIWSVGMVFLRMYFPKILHQIHHNDDDHIMLDLFKSLRQEDDQRQHHTDAIIGEKFSRMLCEKHLAHLLNDVNSLRAMSPNVGQSVALSLQLSKNFLDFMCSILRTNPINRPTANDLLHHAFLINESEGPFADAAYITHFYRYVNKK